MKPAMIALAGLLTAVNVGAALVTISSRAGADVAGLNAGMLARDRDFRAAVKNVVSSDCTVDGDSISC